MPRTVLIVEDSGFTRLNLRNALEKQGYQVVEAVNGKQVFNNQFHQEIGLESVDLVMLDLYLPDYDGSQLLRYLVSKYPNIPVIVISIEQKKEWIIKMIDMGARDYLVKPVDEVTLISRVGKFLAGEKRVQEGEEAKTESKKAVSFDEKAESFNQQLFNEVDRAIRGDYTMTVVKFSNNMEDLSALYEIVDANLRRIDSAFLLDEQLILLLPATGEEGCKVVIDKIFDFSDTLNEEAVDIKRFVFPNDSTRDYIEKYQIQEIVDEIKRALINN